MLLKCFCYCAFISFAFSKADCRRTLHYVQDAKEMHPASSRLSEIDINKYVVVDSKTGIHYNPYSKHHPGRHVCHNQKYVNQEEHNKEYHRPVYKKYMVPCNGNSFQLCSTLRLMYDSRYQDLITNKKASNDVTYVCCPGWTQINTRSHGCNKPKCSQPCLNGGKCVKPELCGCTKGFSGTHCEIEIIDYICEKSCENGGKCIKNNVCSCPKGFRGDYCQINEPYCSKGCNNGGTCVRHELCKCPKGFGGRQCELDIDECKEFKPCDQICYNTYGSFNCQCRENFILLEDGQSCRKEENDTPSEATDFEFDDLDQRLHKLETIMEKNHENEVTKSDLDNVYRDFKAMTKDVFTIKTKIQQLEHYGKEILLTKEKLNNMEKKSERVDDLIVKYNKLRSCIFYNKMCY